jgi:hypothetical protein
MYKSVLIIALIFFFVLQGECFSQKGQSSSDPKTQTKKTAPQQIKYTELPIIEKTVYRIKSPAFTIEGKFKLTRTDEIDLNFVLARMNPGFLVCQIYINEELVKNEKEQIDNKQVLGIKIKEYEAPFKVGENNLKVVFKTTDGSWGCPPFKDNPITIFDESRIGSNNLIAAKFRFQEIADK